MPKKENKINVLLKMVLKVFFLGLCLLSNRKAYGQDAAGADDKSAAKADMKINPNEAKIDAYPFIAFIYNEDKEEFKQFCGGALITLSWILTAAHCSKFFAPEDVPSQIAIMGASKTSYHKEALQQNNNTDLQFQKIAEYKVNGDWRYPSSEHDLCLMRVQTPFIKTRTCRTTKIAIINALEAGINTHNCLAIGRSRETTERLEFDEATKLWTIKSSNESSYLKAQNLTVITSETCKRFSPDWLVREKIDEFIAHDYRNEKLYLLCTLYYPGNKGFCFNESGALLTCDDLLFGIAVSGIGCRTPRLFPGIWVNVALYSHWIMDHVPNAIFVSVSSAA